MPSTPSVPRAAARKCVANERFELRRPRRSSSRRRASTSWTTPRSRSPCSRRGSDACRAYGTTSRRRRRGYRTGWMESRRRTLPLSYQGRPPSKMTERAVPRTWIAASRSREPASDAVQAVGGWSIAPSKLGDSLQTEAITDAMEELFDPVHSCRVRDGP